ncbi:DUF4383 domain-containing protein [Pseudobdellovibrio sp. HCB154]|uniref:DUF4383 domain-containing protein n=1 Tax=Pseudobdellovibrio sp. HCB154 TaxID=3386277 RepID=UPI00391710BF
MNAKNFALVGGIIMLVIGALSLIPAFTGLAFGLPILKIETSYGLFLGIFPLNIVNKAILIGFGLWGVAAASDPALSLPRSISFSRWVFMISALFAVLGLFPQTNTLFGYVPLFGAGIWLHAVMALAGGIFGYSIVKRTA